MSTVSLENVGRTFSSVRALDEVSFDIASGEQLAILGPSGSGKSTALRIIAGLEQPDSGVVRIGGVDQRGLEPHQRDLSIVFQNFALYPHLSSRENITLGLRHGLGLKKAEANKRADVVAEKMRVAELLDRRPAAMSGGQRQRIALARALARRTGVVLLDEPMSGLDAQLHIALRLEITALLRSVGATGITVTHDQMDAMGMAERIVLMREGRVVQIGTPDALYQTPADRFVASFIGSPPMNLFDIDQDQTVFGRFEQAHFDDHRSLGVRPEDLHFGFPPAAEMVSARATVVGVEPHGSERIVHLSSGGSIFSVRCGRMDAPQANELVGVWAAPDDVHVFSGEHQVRTGTLRTLGLMPGFVAARSERVVAYA